MISERLVVYGEATHFPTTSLSRVGKGQREKGVDGELHRCSVGVDQPWSLSTKDDGSWVCENLDG